MDTRERIGELSGKKPSRALGLLFEQVLLPGEPLVAAVRGVIRLQNAWLVVTPALVFVARDGMKPNIEGAAGTAEHLDWRTEESWGDNKLHLELRDATVSLSQLKREQLPVAVSALEQVRQQTVDGRLPLLAPTMAALDSAVSWLHAAAPEVDVLDLANLVAADAFYAVAGAISGWSEVTFELGVLLVGLGNAVPDFARRDRPGVVLGAIQTGFRGSTGDYALWGLGDALTNGAVPSWRSALGAFAEALEETTRLVSAESLDARGRLDGTAQAFRSAASPPVDLVKPAAVAGDALTRTSGPVGADLLETLERLQRLRDTGALTAGEFAQLKQRTLQG